MDKTLKAPTKRSLKQEQELEREELTQKTERFRADLGIQVSITPARFWREQVCLVRLAFPILGIWRRLTFYRDVRPDLGVSSIHLEPLFESRFSVRLDRINRALRLANTAIDAFVRVDDEHVLTLIEAVHRTYLDTVHVLTFDTAFIDDVGQLSLLPEFAPLNAISVVKLMRNHPCSTASVRV